MRGAYLLVSGVLLGCGLWGNSVAYAGGGPPPGRQTLGDRAKGFEKRTLSAGTLARSTGASAAWAVVHPSAAWGAGASSVGLRTASGVGGGFVGGVLQFFVGAARHEVAGYQRCPKPGAWTRIKYAIRNTFLVRRDNHPGEGVAVGRLSGAVGAGLLSRLWQPATLSSAGAGFASGGISLGAGVGLNVFREFWPDLHRRMSRKKENGAAAAAPTRQSRDHTGVSTTSKPSPHG